MKVNSELLSLFHLDSKHSLLTARDVLILKRLFDLLDIRGDGQLDDVQFLGFMKVSTNLSDSEIYRIFDVFDVDKSGSLEFDEFYLLACILISIKDNCEKQFLHYHWRTCFELLDVDGSKTITVPEFLSFGFIFNFNKKLVTQIFKEFDVDDNMSLDHDEFRMFTLYAIDKQMEYDELMLRRKAKLRDRAAKGREFGTFWKKGPDKTLLDFNAPSK